MPEMLGTQARLERLRVGMRPRALGPIGLGWGRGGGRWRGSGRSVGRFGRGCVGAGAGAKRSPDRRPQLGRFAPSDRGRLALRASGLRFAPAPAPTHGHWGWAVCPAGPAASAVTAAPLPLRKARRCPRPCRSPPGTPPSKTADCAPPLGIAHMHRRCLGFADEQVLVVDAGDAWHASTARTPSGWHEAARPWADRIGLGPRGRPLAGLRAKRGTLRSGMRRRWRGSEAEPGPSAPTRSLRSLRQGPTRAARVRSPLRSRASAYAAPAPRAHGRAGASAGPDARRAQGPAPSAQARRGRAPGGSGPPPRRSGARCSRRRRRGGRSPCVRR